MGCATLFQLEGLMDQCLSIMEETINVQTVIKYYETSLMYGTERIRKECLKWLRVNLVIFFHNVPFNFLKAFRIQNSHSIKFVLIHYVFEFSLT